ncbi:MAG: outer membrane lipoprotein-sorting protein, partial [Cyanobacteria bacterium REEB65]|nr:outer membrane lipoprotein-sorting protein [Cyanobacteria bacterium REEB65]
MTSRRLSQAVRLSLPILGTALLGGFAHAARATLDARALVHHVETQYEGQSAHTIFEMKVVTATWTRTMTLESWSQGRDKFLAKILSPMKDAGMATLKVGDQMWNYFPDIDRLMRIPTSLLGQSWMGSDLTNDDLVKAAKVDDLYTFEIGSESPSRVTIVATPRPDAAVVWGHLTYVI